MPNWAERGAREAALAALAGVDVGVWQQSGTEFDALLQMLYGF